MKAVQINPYLKTLARRLLDALIDTDDIVPDEAFTYDDLVVLEKDLQPALDQQYGQGNVFFEATEEGEVTVGVSHAIANTPSEAREFVEQLDLPLWPSWKIEDIEGAGPMFFVTLRDTR
jgi:hypothetical protein